MKKKIAVISLLLLFIVGLAFNFVKVRADSGWDSDYDSWDSSSDWDSDWDSSSSWDSDSHYSSGGGGSAAGAAFVWFIIIIIIIIVLANKNNNNKGGTNPKQHQGNSNITNTVKEEDIQKYIAGFNKDEFLKLAFDNFVAVQNAWTEFNYDKLRSLLTDELYNSYHSQLVALKAKKQKNIMEDFDLQQIDITDMNVTDNKITLKVALTVKFKDYVVDKDDKVTRGTKAYPLINSYNLTFISTLNNKKKDQNKTCPSCGAPLKNTSSNKCEFCGSTIVFNNYDWILSKKEIRR
jgi:hypothetical protein